jgi:hypothetical protein
MGWEIWEQSRNLEGADGEVMAYAKKGSTHACSLPKLGSCSSIMVI